VKSKYESYLLNPELITESKLKLPEMNFSSNWVKYKNLNKNTTEKVNVKIYKISKNITAFKNAFELYNVKFHLYDSINKQTLYGTITVSGDTPDLKIYLSDFIIEPEIVSQMEKNINNYVQGKMNVKTGNNITLIAGKKYQITGYTNGYQVVNTTISGPKKNKTVSLNCNNQELSKLYEKKGDNLINSDNLLKAIDYYQKAYNCSKTQTLEQKLKSAQRKYQESVIR
jgi:hypothetical protein